MTRDNERRRIQRILHNRKLAADNATTERMLFEMWLQHHINLLQKVLKQTIAWHWPNTSQTIMINYPAAYKCYKELKGITTVVLSEMGKFLSIIAYKMPTNPLDQGTKIFPVENNS